MEADWHTQCYFAGGTPETCSLPFKALAALARCVTRFAFSGRMILFSARLGWNPIREASGAEAKNVVINYRFSFHRSVAWSTQKSFKQLIMNSNIVLVLQVVQWYRYIFVML